MGVALQPPTAPLTDGVISLRPPTGADLAAVEYYAASPDRLDGIWMPVPQGASRQRLAAIIEDWLRAWDGGVSHNGPALLLELDGAARFLGHVGFEAREQGVIELNYGIAPDHRGRDLATRATVLAASWLLAERPVDAVELRIGQDHHASRRVADKAGFRLTGTIRQTVAGTTYEDLRYRFTREDASQGG